MERPEGDSAVLAAAFFSSSRERDGDLVERPEGDFGFGFTSGDRD